MPYQVRNYQAAPLTVQGTRKHPLVQHSLRPSQTSLVMAVVWRQSREWGSIWHVWNVSLQTPSSKVSQRRSLEAHWLVDQNRV